MLWILLYPFRGTVEPPRLSRNSRIRRAFYRYGAFTAKRWLKTLLLFSIVAVLLAYSGWVQYLSPKISQLDVPHRTWSSLSIHHDDPNITPDIIVRQIWLHGNYRAALSREVLLAALDIENTLLDQNSFPNSVQDSEQARVNNCSPYSDSMNLWEISSPSFLWNCSAHAILGDGRLRMTAESASSGQFDTESPSLYFAGTGMDPSKVEMADALVISIFDTDVSGSDNRWEGKLNRLHEILGDKISFYASSQSPTNSHLLFYQTKPMTFRDHILLGSAYGTMALYVIIFMYYQRALRSRFGLLFAVITEVTFSALASLAICDYVGINLGELPQEAYPFIVFVLGLDNVFRLINTLFSLPPQSSAVVRIANALGDVGYLSLITGLQNLIVLWVLTLVVTPSVAAFCTYAAIALIFDVAFQLTFLVAVISVDIRRIELEDSLNQILAKRQALSSGTGVSWVLELFKNTFQFHSRVAATFVVVSFIALVDSHFIDRRLGCWLGFCQPSSLSRTITSRLTEIPTTPALVNRVDSLHEWVMNLDFSQVQKAVRNVDLFADKRILIRIYDPIVAMVKDSDRLIPRSRQFSFITTPLEIASRHFIPFIITLVITMFALTLLMKFLLWNDSSDDDLGGDPMHNMLSVQAGTQCHTSDVEKLYSSRKGHFISISLDRSIFLYIYNDSDGRFNVIRFPTSSEEVSLWPLKTMAIDDSGSWVAAYTPDGHIFLWNVRTRGFQRRFDLFSSKPRCPEMSLFRFVTTRSGDKLTTALILMTNFGLVSHIDVNLPIHDQPIQFTNSLISSSDLITYPSGEVRLSFSTVDGKVGIFSKLENGSWKSISLPSNSNFSELPSSASTLKQPQVVLTVLALVVGVSSNGRMISLCSLNNLDEIYSISLGDDLVAPSNLRVVHSLPRACPYCSGVAVHNLSVVYSSSSGLECVMHTFTSRLQDDQDLICLGTSSLDRSGLTGTPVGSLKRGQKRILCHTLEDAARSTHRVAGSGVWEATRSQSVIGIRRRPVEQGTLLSSSRRSSLSLTTMPSYKVTTVSNPVQSKPRLRLAHRRRAVNPSTPDSTVEAFSSSFSSPFASVRRKSNGNNSGTTLGPWEIFALSSSGEVSFELLVDPFNPDVSPNELFRVIAPIPENLPFVSSVSSLEPIGERSVAIAFGNRVWLITLGPSERFDGMVFATGNGGQLDVSNGTAIAGWRRNRGGRRST